MTTLTGPDWMFDDSLIPDPFGHAARALRFVDLLRHPKSTRPGRALVLSRHYRRTIAKILGPCHEDGTRICRVFYLNVGRGGRKTFLGTIMGLIFFVGPQRKPYGQIFTAAADTDQGRIAFEEMVSIIKATPELDAVCRVQDFRSQIIHEKSGSIYRVQSSDAKTEFGKTGIFTHVDEWWAHKKRDLVDAIETSAVKVPGTLIMFTTTAGRGSESPDYEHYEYAKKIALGEIVDPSQVVALFEADPAEPFPPSDELLRAVNPGLRDLDDPHPDIRGLRDLALKAVERPSGKAAFLQFHLGIRQDHSVAPFVSMAVYDECSGEVDLKLLRGQPCWIGFDCSSTTDLTAVIGAWRADEDGFLIAAWFFVPEKNLQARADRDQVPYVRWRDEGYIIATEGNAVDYRAVEAKIRELVAMFDVKEIAGDRAYGQPVIGPLVQDGLPVVTLPQGWVTQSPALNVLERAIVSRKLKHGGHPVLRWCFENAVVHTDSAGNRVLHKGKSRDRIDGAAAAWMAVSRAAAVETGRSIYDRPELWVAGVSPSADPASEKVSQAETPSRDGFNWEILNNPRHPEWQAERERYELHLQAREETVDAW